MNNTLTLPWPPRACSPNMRTHWAVLSVAKKKYKKDCFNLTKEAVIKVPTKPFMHVQIYPPSKRRMDIDNVWASCKSGLDGMAQALGIDDSIFRDYRLTMMDQVGGMVKITFSEVIK